VSLLIGSRPKLSSELPVILCNRAVVDFYSVNSEMFSPAKHFSCVPQNRHATANAAVPSRQRDPKKTLSSAIPRQINRLCYVSKPSRFGRRTALFRGVGGDLMPKELRALLQHLLRKYG
jgi:hypothetical protein